MFVRLYNTECCQLFVPGSEFLLSLLLAANRFIKRQRLIRLVSSSLVIGSVTLSMSPRLPSSAIKLTDGMPASGLTGNKLVRRNVMGVAWTERFGGTNCDDAELNRRAALGVSSSLVRLMMSCEISGYASPPKDLRGAVFVGTAPRRPSTSDKFFLIWRQRVVVASFTWPEAGNALKRRVNWARLSCKNLFFAVCNGSGFCTPNGLPFGTVKASPRIATGESGLLGSVMLRWRR